VSLASDNCRDPYHPFGDLDLLEVFAGGVKIGHLDAAMNDLLRPTLYDAWMAVVPVSANSAGAQIYDIVGPVCESGDWLARDRDLAIAASDLLAITSAGAYGMVMSSNYNARPRAAEVMVDGDRYYCVRRRETVAELFAGESTLP
jgi:diaminopimelate decarboxylase